MFVYEYKDCEMCGKARPHYGVRVADKCIGCKPVKRRLTDGRIKWREYELSNGK